MISQNLQKVFTDAVNYARANNHEYITTEHIFVYLLKSESIANLLLEMQMDVDLLYAQLKDYIIKKYSKISRRFNK